LHEFGLASTLRLLGEVTLRDVPRSPDNGVIADYRGAIGDPERSLPGWKRSPGSSPTASFRRRSPRSSSSAGGRSRADRPLIARSGRDGRGRETLPGEVWTDHDHDVEAGGGRDGDRRRERLDGRSRDPELARDERGGSLLPGGVVDGR